MCYVFEFGQPTIITTPHSLKIYSISTFLLCIAKPKSSYIKLHNERANLMMKILDDDGIADVYIV